MQVKITLLQCDHNVLFVHNCHHYEDAGIRCSEELGDERLLNISVDIINVHTGLITWNIQNSTQHWFTSYVVKCFSEYEGHHIEMSASNSTFSVQLVGLFPSTPYNCCVSALYESYIYTRACTEEIVTIHPDEVPMTKPNERENSNQLVDTIIIIGGLLGSITVILFILLVVCGILLAISCRLQSRFSKTMIPKG